MNYWLCEGVEEMIRIGIILGRCRFHIRIGSCLAGGVLLFLCGRSFAGDAPAANSWPMFRGNQGLTGVSQVQLPNKLAPLWNFKTQGPVKSSAAVQGRRVFVGSNDSHVYALELHTGQKLWAFKT